VSVFSFKPLTKLSDAIGENQTADDSMNIIIAQEDENSNIEENRSMAPNIGSSGEIDNRSSPSPYSDKSLDRINQTTSGDGSNIRMQSSTPVYDPNIPIGHQLHDLTYTIERLIGIVGSLNQNINQLNQDMTRLGNGMGNLREDMQDLKTNFCYGLLSVVVLVVILKTKMTNC
jgi:hypothetical protein